MDLAHVPEELKTPEVCLAAVKNAGRALAFVPDALKTPDFCLAAVRSNGCALEYVPDELIRKGFAYGVLDIEGMKKRILSWNGVHQETVTEE